MNARSTVAQAVDPPSFERINYAIRPAKATQRHMLVEAIGRLCAFAPLHDYQYIGFGSTFFVDFRLLHQRYGTRRLFSIEREVGLRARFELNKPLGCITMLYGDSREKLLDPVINWSDHPSIVWLDYDEPIDREKLADCQRVLRRCAHGSMLVVTVSSEAGRRPSGRLARWSERLRDQLPYGETDFTLDDMRVGEISLDALQAVANDTLASRSGGWKQEQILRMRYRDGAPMVTWAGVVTQSGGEGRIGSCRFSQLPFVRRAGRGTYELGVSNLTPVERALIESKLPSGIRSARATLRRHSIPDTEADALRAVYRHAPRFVETFA